MAKEKRQENLIQLIREYQEEHPGEPYELSDVIDWAIESGQLDAPNIDALLSEWKAALAEELQQAACKEHHRDGKGRRVRSFYSAKVVCEENGRQRQRHLWNERCEATWEFKIAAIDSRFGQIAGDIASLQIDVDSLNEFDRPKGKPPIQLHLDFRGLGKSGGKTA